MKLKCPVCGAVYVTYYIHTLVCEYCHFGKVVPAGICADFRMGALIRITPTIEGKWVGEYQVSSPTNDPESGERVGWHSVAPVTLPSDDQSWDNYYFYDLEEVIALAWASGANAGVVIDMNN